MIISTLSPCPEDHVDDGRVEANIIAAWRRMAAGMDAVQCHKELLAKGVSLDDAHLAVQAALVLL